MIHLRKSVVPVAILFLFAVQSTLLAFPVKDAQLILDNDYGRVAREAIKGSRKSVKVMLFEAVYYEKYPDTPSNMIIRELIAAQKRGVKVEVVLEQGESTDRTTQRNYFTAKLLAREGVDVTLDSPTVVTHAKFLVVDTGIVILGSTNWTYSALTTNHEVSVLIRSPEMGQALSDYFKKVKGSGRKFLP